MVRPNPGRPARSQKTNEAEHPPERKETIVEQRHVECGGVSRRFRTVGKRRLTPPHSKAPALPQQQIPRNHWEFLGSVERGTWGTGGIRPSTSRLPPTQVPRATLLMTRHPEQ